MLMATAMSATKTRQRWWRRTLPHPTVPLIIVSVVAVISAAAVGLVVAARSNTTDKVTVSEAIVRMLDQPAGQRGEDIHIGRPPAYRVKELAEALGVPESSLPQGALAIQPQRAQSRAFLESLLVTAIDNGSISEADAEVIMRAFDLGLVDIPTAPVIADGWMH